jgi:hypothetical protein
MNHSISGCQKAPLRWNVIMTVSQIIAAGVPGAESAALDVAIRFHIPYSGYTTQGSLMAGDRPPGRYRLEERPFVNPMVLMRANLERADGLLVFAHGSVPRPIDHLLPLAGEENRPTLHIDFLKYRPDQAAFRIDRWVRRHDLSHPMISGSSLMEDKQIYHRVRDALTCFFMLDRDAPTAGPGRTMH